ncbi:MAG: response regulator transcription factor [Defluviitaleaceae bacterium]|nr:response regulator transcription factor [Defluviitaleaceae bacterium]
MEKQFGGGYILMVEDEPVVQANNKKILERRGYVTRQAFSLAEARKHIKAETPRAIVLDINLPDGSGLDFLQELRKTSNIPVLMLTAMGTQEDIIHGLEAGGDDYLPKPYDLAVFLVRINALLRRASLLPESLDIGSIRIDIPSGKAYVNNVDMNLPPKELSLLQQFTQHPEQMLTNEFLYEKVWGQKLLAGSDNSLKVAISKLRHKLDGSGFTITTAWGEGYCFERE